MKARTFFVCQSCGGQSPKWLGRCPDCGEWASLVEEAAPAGGGAPRDARSPGGAPRRIAEIETESHPRVPCGVGELDRVLGGGLVPGSLVLIGGDPGIGKSTLLMQAASRLAATVGPTLYVTGEESTHQVKLRAERLDAITPDLYLAAETDVEVVEAQTRSLKPAVLVIDSIQTAHDPALDSAPGTVSQVRASCARLLRLAKETHTSVFLVGHVTKEGALAGPRVLEHMVDVVLYFEGDRFQSHRILRGVKNRFGSTDEIGLFEMTGGGLREIPSASELFLSQRPAAGPGSAVVAVMEGTRPVLIEVQALVARSFLNSPRRTANGVDYNRACMLLAVLERRCGMRLSDKDVYVNVAGGIRVAEPAADLGIALALAGSFRDRATAPEVVVCGEVGLGGELRAVQQLDRRLREAERMGFRRAVVPAGKDAPAGALQVTRAATLQEALDSALQPAAGNPGPDDDPFA
jgi:DNA repair protein RadA/Sms